MRHRTPLAYLALVIVLFLAGDRLGAAAIGYAVDSSDFRFVRIHRGGLDEDILVVGDSRGVHSVFAPELSAMLCQSVFNAAFNGMSGEVAEAVVKDYLKHNKPPKAVLIEVSNAADEPTLVNELRLFARDPGPIRDLVRQHDPWNEIWFEISHLYAFNNEMALRALYYLHHSDQDWIIVDKPMTRDLLEHIPRDEFAGYHFRPASVAALRRLIDLLKTRGIEPVPYIAPFHPYFHKLVPNYGHWVAELQREIGADHPILDMSRSFGDNENFTDLLHVNIHGSRKVMGVLAARLRQDMPDQIAGMCPTSRSIGQMLPQDGRAEIR